MASSAVVIVPFKCEACGRDFAPAEGGKCRQCGRLLCGDHFARPASEPVCVSCRPSGSASEVSVGGVAIVVLSVSAMLAVMVGSIYYPYPNGQSLDAKVFISRWLRELMAAGLLVVMAIIWGAYGCGVSSSGVAVEVPTSSNTAIKATSFGRWTRRDKAPHTAP